MNEPTTPADNQNAPMAVASGAVLRILQSTTYWTAGIFHSWTEGRGAKAFRNCSIKPVPGEFKTKADAIVAAEKVIKDKTTYGVHWNTAQPSASFCIPHEANQKIGEALDAMMPNDRDQTPPI
jgi:hypothetical protein